VCLLVVPHQLAMHHNMDGPSRASECHSPHWFRRPYYASLSVLPPDLPKTQAEYKLLHAVRLVGDFYPCTLASYQTADWCRVVKSCRPPHMSCDGCWDPGL